MRATIKRTSRRLPIRGREGRPAPAAHLGACALSGQEAWNEYDMRRLIAADVDKAAAAEPGLTIGELVDKTTDKLTFMEGYMEGCARMVNMEAALSSRAGAEHRDVLAKAEKLLHKAEEYLD